MSAIVKPVGSLKQYLGGKSEATVEAGRSIRETIASLHIPPPVVALALVNGKPADKDYVLQDGDELKLLAVIGGG